MKKSQALHAFFNSFAIDAYAKGTVPTNAEPPYLTYEKGFSRDGYSATAHIYYRTTSEIIPDDKAEEICDSLRDGGKQITCDGGCLWIQLDYPEWYSAEDNDPSIKHRVINYSITDHTI